MAGKIFEIPLDELAEVNTLFKNANGIDMENIPEKYGQSVENARRRVASLGHALAVYDFFTIEKKEETGVTTTEGLCFTGDVTARFLKNAEKGLCFVASLPGFDRLTAETEDIMENYFMDSWGSAFIQATQLWCKKYFERQIEETERLTYVWSPGQYRFDLTNQKPLFAFLEPECIGVSLNAYCKMDPVKSVSGVCGIVARDDTYDLQPCLFCSFGKSCPSYLKGCGKF